ncbi:MAG TPA: stage II sporulation protein D [Clostridiales bacterium]|nr:stage II sporulation protein D [Clostridiales bacterium]
MKKVAIIGFIFVLILATVPLLALQGNTQPQDLTTNTQATDSTTSSDIGTSPEKDATQPTSHSTDHTAAVTSYAETKNLTFKILDKGTDTIVEIPDKEFCCGALATQMDTNHKPEALKAQVIALYSYYCYLRNTQRATPDAELRGADFSGNSKVWQVYTTTDQLKEKWGSTFEDSYKAISTAVDEVFGTIVTYDGRVAKTEFHQISSGSTESSSDIYGEAFPYLIQVASPFDTTTNNYQTVVKLSAEDFNKKMIETWDDYSCDSNPNNIVGDCTRTSSGSITEIAIGNKALTGNQVQKAFNLRSSNFSLLYTEDKFVFTVKGYGSGVGMSQNGANEMAQQGSSYKEILYYYYPNTTLATNANPME